MSNQLAEQFLKSPKKLSAICDAVLTGDEFREFCDALQISPMERIRITQMQQEENRVPSALKLWFEKKPTVKALKTALESWKHPVLIAKLGLDKSFVDEVDSKICVVCLSNEKEVAFSPCGHRCCCAVCATEILAETLHLCPICRTAVDSTLKVFV